MAEAFGSHSIAQKRALVIVPHPDDEAICCSGIITRLLRDEFAVRIVVATLGNKYRPSFILNKRLEESVDGMSELGVGEEAITFLAYPDGELSTLHSSPITGKMGVKLTSADRGYRKLDYHSAVFNSSAYFTYDNLYLDLYTIISTFLPQHIFLANTRNDSHPDHTALLPIVEDILGELFIQSCEKTNENLNMDIVLHHTPVWANEPIWPNPVNINKAFVKSPHYESAGIYKWSDKESITLPGSMFLYDISTKEKAIMHHETQSAKCGFLSRFIHSNEMFWAERFSLGLECDSKKPSAMLTAVVNSEPLNVIHGEAVPLIGNWKWTVLGDSAEETKLSVQKLSKLKIHSQWQQRTGPEIVFVKNTQKTYVVIPESAQIGTIFEFEYIAQTEIDGRTITSLPTSIIFKLTASKDKDYGTNIAASASINNEGFFGNKNLTKLVDGNPDGFVRMIPTPIGSDNEWVTTGTNSTNLLFKWNSNYLIRKIVLYDTPRCDIHAERVYIQFPNKKFGPYNLPNDGRPMEIIIPGQNTNQLSLYLQGPSFSLSIGLAEVEIYGIPQSAVEFTLLSYLAGMFFQIVGIVLVLKLIKPNSKMFISERP